MLEIMKCTQITLPSSNFFLRVLHNITQFLIQGLLACTKPSNPNQGIDNLHALPCPSISTEPLRHTQNALTDSQVFLTFTFATDDLSASLATLPPVKEVPGAHQTEYYHNSIKYYIMH